MRRDPLVGSTVVWETGEHFLHFLLKFPLIYGGLFNKRIELTDHAEYPVIKWVRESKSEQQPPPSEQQPPSHSVWTARSVVPTPGNKYTIQIPLYPDCGPGADMCVPWSSYVQMHNGGAPAQPVYCGETLWGNVFVQAMKVGLASYHFVPPAGAAAGDEDQPPAEVAAAALGSAYISYEHPHCAQWPPLDDGSPVPARVPFTDLQWDVAAKTFRGTIDWRTSHQTSWQGVDKWECLLRGMPSKSINVALFLALHSDTFCSLE